MVRPWTVDHRRETLVMLLLTGLITAGAFWVQLPVWSEDPARALSRLLIGPAFALSGLLLITQEGQRRNAWWLVAGASGMVAHQAVARPPGALTVVLYVVPSVSAIVIATVLLRYTSDLSPRATRLFCRIGVVAGIAVFTAVALTTRPEWRGYGDIPWPSLWPDREINKNLISLTRLWASGMAVTFGILFARHWRQISRFERHVLAPIMWTTVAATIGYAALLVQRFLLPAGLDRYLDLVRTYGATSVAVAFVVSAIRIREAQSDVAQLAARLAARPTVEEVENGLREVLADDNLNVLYWLPDQETYVGSDGVPATFPEPDAERLVVKAVSTDGTPLALLIGDAGLRRYGRLVDAALGVSHLALENARLEASLRAQLVAVQDARARLLHTGLKQRRQLERDLHDGAQQRLLAVGMRLGAIEIQSEDSATAAQVQLARKELHMALDELRDLAHGIYPAVLTQAGLGPAIVSVLERLPLAVDLSVPDRRWPADVESAAYLIVCEALTNAAKHAGPCNVSVQVTNLESELLVVVADNGEGNATLEDEGGLGNLRDRVETLGGSFAVSSTATKGTRIEARIPCG